MESWLGWNEALGWAPYQVDGNDRRWDLPPTTLGELAKFLAKTLQTRSVRVIGDPNLRVVKVASGRNLGSMAQAVDCIIASDAREYDTFEYARDAVFCGRPKGSDLHLARSQRRRGHGLVRQMAQALRPRSAGAVHSDHRRLLDGVVAQNPRS